MSHRTAMSLHGLAIALPRASRGTLMGLPWPNLLGLTMGHTVHGYALGVSHGLYP